MKSLLVQLKNNALTDRAKWLLVFLITLSLAHFWSSGYRDALVWGSFLVLLALAVLKKIPLRINIVLIAVALYIAWALAGSFYSVNPSNSIRSWYKLVELAAAAFVVMQLPRSRTTIDRALLFVVIALTIIYFYDIAVYLQGLGDQWRWGERWDDRWSKLLHYNAPNIYSALIVAIFPLAYYLLLNNPRRPVMILCALHFCAGFFLLYVFASRGAQIALAAMILLQILLFRGWKKKGAGILVIVVFAGLIFMLNPRFSDPTMKNFFKRDENWRNTLELIRERPWLGCGYGNEIYKEVYHEEFPDSAIKFKHTHNLLLKVLFESGIAGLIVYLLIWIAIFWGMLKIFFGKDERRRSLALAILLAFWALFIYFLGSIPNGINRCFFWFMTGVAAAVLSIYKKEKMNDFSEQKTR